MNNLYTRGTTIVIVWFNNADTFTLRVLCGQNDQIPLQHLASGPVARKIDSQSLPAEKISQGREAKFTRIFITLEETPDWHRQFLSPRVFPGQAQGTR